MVKKSHFVQYQRLISAEPTLSIITTSFMTSVNKTFRQQDVCILIANLEDDMDNPASTEPNEDMDIFQCPWPLRCLQLLQPLDGKMYN
jgi:hypothetical protein